MRAIGLFIAALGLHPACSPDFPDVEEDGAYACNHDGDCVTGYVCAPDRCRAVGTTWESPGPLESDVDDPYLYVVPEDCHAIHIRAWGAGGFGGADDLAGCACAFWSSRNTTFKTSANSAQAGQTMVNMAAGTGGIGGYGGPGESHDAPGGAGGIGSGGDENLAGGSGEDGRYCSNSAECTSAEGGNAAYRGGRGAAGVRIERGGGTGASPGGGGSGANAGGRSGGGGGGGGYVRKTVEVRPGDAFDVWVAGSRGWYCDDCDFPPGDGGDGHVIVSCI